MATRSKETHVLFLLLVGLLAWIVPGAGHLALKKAKHALIIFVTIVLTFFLGLNIGSIGIIDPIGSKPWYVAQIMNSPAVTILGHLSSNWLLFSIGFEYQNDLNNENEIVSDSLLKRFGDEGITLTKDARISTEYAGYEWVIIDNLKAYKAQKKDGIINIYHDFSVYGKAREIGQIYTSITGLLNLLCIVNAVYWAHLAWVKETGD